MCYNHLAKTRRIFKHIVFECVYHKYFDDIHNILHQLNQFTKQRHDLFHKKFHTQKPQHITIQIHIVIFESAPLADGILACEFVLNYARSLDRRPLVAGLGNYQQ